MDLKTLLKKYETWVASNPEAVGDVETTTKWVSYFIAGRISNSNILSELIYSLSNMLVLYNDRIIDKSRGVNAATPLTDECYRLKVMLTTLEYAEVFIEISAKRMWGARGKWLIVVLLQVIKATGRLVVLKKSRDKIISSPPMPSLNRKGLAKNTILAAANVNETLSINEHILEEHSFTFKLKRSGRVIRKVEGAPPLQYRDFKLDATQSKPSFSPLLLKAEYLYVAKPLIHLASMALFGEKKWKQFVTSLTVDLACIHLYYKNRHLMSKQQKLELSRRCINLLLYLVRSPFYERFTQSRLDAILGFMADKVPLVKMVAAPLRDYIPHWQNTYFYLWST